MEGKSSWGGNSWGGNRHVVSVLVARNPSRVNARRGDRFLPYFPLLIGRFCHTQPSVCRPPARKCGGGGWPTSLVQARYAAACKILFDETKISAELNNAVIS